MRPEHSEVCMCVAHRLFALWRTTVPCHSDSSIFVSPKVTQVEWSMDKMEVLYRRHIASKYRCHPESLRFTIHHFRVKGSFSGYPQGHSVKCLFSIHNYRVKATFYRVSQTEEHLLSFAGSEDTGARSFAFPPHFWSDHTSYSICE
jgi:hypothetical protein